MTDAKIIGITETHGKPPLRPLALHPVPDLLKRDLSHISTERLKALAERYQRRMTITPQDREVQMKWQFVGNEIGLRQLVADIEKDLSGGEQ